MARAAKATTTTKPAARGRKPGRPALVAAKTPKVAKPAVVPKRAALVPPKSTGRKPGRSAALPAKTPAKVTKVAAAPPKRVMVAAAPALKLSKDELRVQVEKLERANATLRAKNREANRTAKAATARIAELEEHVAQLEKTVVVQAPSANGETAAKPPRARRQSRGVDHDHSEPAGVADQKPAPLDEEG